MSKKVETPVVQETQANMSKKVETPVVQETQATQKPKVGERARQLILEGVLDNKGILAQIQKEYPEGKTSIACIAWYKSDLKKKAPIDGFKQWLKDNEAKLRAEYEAQQVKA